MAETNETNAVDFYLTPAPHIASKRTTQKIMLSVVVALFFVALYGIVLFGATALVTILVSVACCVGFESLFRLLTKQDIRAKDFSAVVTGLLLALTLPPTMPVWMTALGALFAVVVAKELFGGLGANVFNPALAGRAFLFVSFSSSMSSWTRPFSAYGVDAVSSATPLSFLKPSDSLSVLSPSQIASRMGFDSVMEMYAALFTGQRAGCIGESAIPVILVAGIILIAAKIIDWRAPAAMIVSALVITWIAGMDPILTLLSGGLLFGAVFMATDYATAPQTPWGRLVFGAGCGVITALIRIFSSYPEGVMFSILIMNALAPFLNKIIDRKYGWTPKPKKARAKPRRGNRI